MTSILKGAVFCCVLTLAGTVEADPNCLFPIQQGQGPIRELTLNQQVYDCISVGNYQDIRVINGDGNVVPYSVITEQLQSQSFVESNYYWLAPVKTEQLQHGRDWQFTVPAQYPVSSVRFLPDDETVLFSGLIYSQSLKNQISEPNQDSTTIRRKRDRLRDLLKKLDSDDHGVIRTKPESWRVLRRFEYLIFPGTTNLETMSSVEPVIFRSRIANLWRIKFDQPSEAILQTNFPDIEFGWIPAQVKFIAQGPEPFSLEVGLDHPSVKPKGTRFLPNSDTIVEAVKLLPSIDKLIEAVNPIDHEPEIIEKDISRSSYSISKILLWVVLLTGVLLMTIMAWQLKPQIGGSDENLSGGDNGKV
jgi:hypothetical protein